MGAGVTVRVVNTATLKAINSGFNGQCKTKNRKERAVNLSQGTERQNPVLGVGPLVIGKASEGQQGSLLQPLPLEGTL